MEDISSYNESFSEMLRIAKHFLKDFGDELVRAVIGDLVFDG